MESENYLDYIPRRKETLYVVDEAENVTILQTNKGIVHWLAQKLLRKPRVTQVHLDSFGNFIWPLMDGQHTIGDIADLVKKRFGVQAEPLYPRLLQYMRKLEEYGFVEVSPYR